MSDLTRLLQTLQPTPDGESAVRHRTAVVDAVNADGTVDLDFDGTIIPDVSVLDGAVTAAGESVQVAAWAGDLLVLGTTRYNQGGSLGLLPNGYAQITSNSAAFTAEASIAGLSITVIMGVDRKVKITADFSLQSSVLNDNIAIRIKEGGAVLKRGDYRIVAANAVQSHHLEFVGTPVAGSKTWNITAQRLTGSGSCLVVGAADGRHSAIWAEDIGAA